MRNARGSMGGRGPLRLTWTAPTFHTILAALDGNVLDRAGPRPNRNRKGAIFS